MDNQKGHWITTKDGRHLFIKEDLVDKQEREIKEREEQTRRLTNEMRGDTKPTISLKSFRAMSLEDADAYFNSLKNTTKSGMNDDSKVQTLIDNLNMHDKPVVLSDDEFDSRVNTDAVDAEEIYRGFGNQSDSTILDSIKFGDTTYIGNGAHGDGIYFSDSPIYAAHYAKGGNLDNSTITAYLDKQKTRMIDAADLVNTKEYMSLSPTSQFVYDPTAYALWKGYNVVVRHRPDGSSFYILLDRSPLVIREHTRVGDDDRP